MSDTPRTDEQINGKPCTRFAILAGDSLRNAAVPSEFARNLERELNAANERIKNLESALCTVQNIDKVNAYQDLESANERIKRLEAVINDPHALWANWLRGSVTLPVGIGDVREYQDRIKRLEEAGDCLCEAASFLHWYVQIEHWRKAKEAKP